ncbi:hypothetical protein [Bdellovibrio sp. BCCA]|uniref:hypothetical protein n=1 Tax=Bdellovibrio sp. BCCA TaxID=3136281 RepID=UPI0030F1380C
MSKKFGLLLGIFATAGLLTAVGKISPNEVDEEILNQHGAKVLHIKNGTKKPVSFLSYLEMYPSFIGCSQNLASTEEWEFQCSDCWKKVMRTVDTVPSRIRLAPWDS